GRIYASGRNFRQYCPRADRRGSPHGGQRKRSGSPLRQARMPWRHGTLADNAFEKAGKTQAAADTARNIAVQAQTDADFALAKAKADGTELVYFAVDSSGAAWTPRHPSRLRRGSPMRAMATMQPASGPQVGRPIRGERQSGRQGKR